MTKNRESSCSSLKCNSMFKWVRFLEIIFLKVYMLAFETLNFSPLGELTASKRSMLYQKLEDCTMTFGKHIDRKHWNDQSRPYPYGIISLADFFIYKGLSVIEEDNEIDKIHCVPTDAKNCYSANDISPAFYSGINIMNTVPRNVTDIWFTFNRSIEIDEQTQQQVDGQKQDEDATKKQAGVGDWAKKLELVADLCRNILLRDGVLDPKARSLTRGGFFNDQLGGWNFEALPIVTRSVVDHGIVVRRLNDENKTKKKNLNKARCHFDAFKSMGWRFRMPIKSSTKQQTGTTNEPSQKLEIDRQPDDLHGIEYVQLGKEFSSIDHLDTDTSGALILFHDLLALGETYRSHSFLLKSGIEHVKHKSWCMTTWKRGLNQSAELPWYRPRCRSFWGLDLFLYAWNHALDNETLINGDNASELLAFVWLSAGTGVISIDRPVINSDIEKVTEEKWKELGGKLNDMATGIKEDSPASVQIQSWLISVALMIMPETGLNYSSELYIGQDKLLEFWKTYSRTIRRIRYKRLKLICEAEMNDLARSFYQDTPDKWSDTNIEIDQFRPYKLEDNIYTNEVKEKAICALNATESKDRLTIPEAATKYDIPNAIVARWSASNKKTEQ